jgi:hypothetical protein
MDLQSLAVALLVAACTARATWTLMPSGWRRRIAIAALELPLPAALATRMRRHADRGPGCGCEGCDHAVAKQPSAAPTTTVRPITLHRRAPR